jgi:hypothetical protein
MAIYYVRTDGNDLNIGTGTQTTQAWKTLAKALGATGITGGDTLYIAPGVYRETITLGFSSSASTTYIIGDPTATKFSGITAAPVRITSYLTSDTLGLSGNNLISAIGKSNVSFDKLYLETYAAGIYISSCENFSLTNSVISAYAQKSNAYGVYIYQNSSTIPHRFENLIMFGGTGFQYQPITPNTTVTSPLIAKNIQYLGYRLFYSGFGYTLSTPMIFTNCSAVMSEGYAIQTYGTGTSMLNFVNCTLNTSQYASVIWNQATHIAFINCRLSGDTQHHPGTPASLSGTTYGTHGMELGESLLYGLTQTQMFSSKQNGVLVAAGTSSGIAISDLYSYPWQNGVPDIGAAQYRNISTISVYTPYDKSIVNYSFIPGITGQSLNMYLGATGITYTHPTLQGYYLRERSNPVAFGFTAQTPTGSWVSGGLAEINSSNHPGTYRIDIPDAAFASGAKNVLISVRGGGVNGAYAYVDLNNIRQPDIESRTFVAGNSNVTEYIFISQLYGDAGIGLTGLAYNTSGLTAYYVRPLGSPTQISLASQTTTGAWTSGGFKEVDGTNMPGIYRIDIPNAVFTAGVTEAMIFLKGANNMNPIKIQYR